MKKILKCFVYAISWFIIENIVVLIFSNSPARVAYGWISAWWGALYISRVLELKMDSLLILVLFSIINTIIVYFMGHGLDIPDILMLIFGLVLYLTPFLLNSLIVLIERRVFKRQ